MSEHTKEPWVFQYDHDYTLDEVNGYFVTGANGGEIFYADNDDRPETWGNLKRAAECVNALAGYNPAALAALVEAAEEAFSLIGRPDSFEGLKDSDTVQINPTVTIGQVKRFRTALTAFRAGEAS